MLSEDISSFKQDLDQIRAGASAVGSLGISPSHLAVVGALSSALVVLLSGRFESFLKSLMRSFIDEVNASYVSFEKLPLNLRATHFRQGAKVLQDSIAAAREAEDFTYVYNLSSRLASVSREPFEAAWEAFTNTQANPGPETVKSLLSNVGISDCWKHVRARTSAHGDLKLALESFIEIRNECAHTGSNASPLSPADIIDYADTIETLGDALVGLLMEHGARCVAA